MPSYIWPDQKTRVQAAESAFAFAASMRWRVERADAADRAETRLAEPAPADHARVLTHAIMWQYRPRSTQERITVAMRAAGETSSRGRRLAWLRMEADGAKDAAVTLATWPDGEERQIARADFHGRWVEWR